LRPAL